MVFVASLGRILLQHVVSLFSPGYSFWSCVWSLPTSSVILLFGVIQNRSSGQRVTVQGSNFGHESISPHAKNKMKVNYDSAHRKVHFQVEDHVLLRLHSHRQNSTAARSNKKLSPRYYGPFEVNRRLVYRSLHKSIWSFMYRASNHFGKTYRTLQSSQLMQR